MRSAKNVGKYLSGNLPQQIIPIMMPSPPAADLFANQSLDLVFIDGDHEHDAVRNDMLAWLPKVRRGGIICGHEMTRCMKS